MESSEVTEEKACALVCTQSLNGQPVNASGILQWNPENHTQLGSHDCRLVICASAQRIIVAPPCSCPQRPLTSTRPRTAHVTKTLWRPVSDLDVVIHVQVRNTHSACLQIIARHQASWPILAAHLGLPPPVVLVADDGKHVAFGERKLLGDCGLIHV